MWIIMIFGLSVTVFRASADAAARHFAGGLVKTENWVLLCIDLFSIRKDFLATYYDTCRKTIKRNRDLFERSIRNSRAGRAKVH
jgi:hypothetical protein